MDRPDIVYVVRDGDPPELKYSLRTLQNIRHGNVWFAGARPAWANVNHIPVPQTGTKYQNSARNLRAAVNHPDVAETFLLFNDDFFVTEPVDPFPDLNRGPLEPILSWYETKYPNGYYTRGMRNTYNLLRTLGYTAPLSYELHIPLRIRKRQAAEVFALLDQLIADGTTQRPLHWRTVYGNLTNLIGTTTRDVKVYKRTEHLPPGPFASTNDRTFLGGIAGRQIRISHRRPSPYEQTKTSTLTP